MVNHANSITALVEQFSILTPKLHEWGKIVDKSLHAEICKRNSLQFIQIGPNHRVKELHSFLNKVTTRKQYHDPIVDTEDKVGTRVVVLKSSDITLTEQCIENIPIWEHKKTKSIRDLDPEKAGFFGYQSLHFVVWPKICDDFPDENENKKLTCEIQIRTLLQHAFAEITHDTTYKGAFRQDYEMLRSLSKAMALMEATDDYFCNVYTMMEEKSREINNILRLVDLEYKKLQDPTPIAPDREAAFELIHVMKERFNIDKFNKFVENNINSLKYAIETNNYPIIHQPLYLLAAFYLATYKMHSKENWPFSSESRNQVLITLGKSPEDY